MTDRPKPVMLIILDGWGWSDEVTGNAVRLADTPVFDRLWREAPHAFLRTCGADVGLPDGQVGNSEVGHMNIGAGRVVMQDLPRIDAAVADGSLAKRPALVELTETLKASGGVCHLIGLVSDGGVHSHERHALALARALTAAGIAVRVHAFTDGRDTLPRRGAAAVRGFAAALSGGASIATVCGRYYAMDRDNRWDRVSRAYDLLVSARGARADDPAGCIEQAYARDITDEFIEPTAIGDCAGMADGDGVLCFNYRADRVRELLTALLDPDFAGFARARTVRFAAAVGMTRYSDALADRLGVLFPPHALTNKLGEIVSRAGLSQLRLAETEKYPHVTYFLNGGEEGTLPGEEHLMVPSPHVATYDLKPEMSAPELTEKALAAIAAGRHDLLVLNFANPDMVGHTGVLAAAIKAVATVDACLGRLIEAVTARGGVLLITADHGNSETMLAPDGSPHTSHTLNRVPVMLAGRPGVRLHDGRLADIAPTVLALLGLPQPREMTGVSLLDPA